LGGGGVIVLDIATARNAFLAALKAMCKSASVRCLLGAYVVLVMVVRKLMRDAPELQQCQAAELGVSVGMQRLLVIVVCVCVRERERESARARAREIQIVSEIFLSLFTACANAQLLSCIHAHIHKQVMSGGLPVLLSAISNSSNQILQLCGMHGMRCMSCL
jgi:hypothetical protein